MSAGKKAAPKRAILFALAGVLALAGLLAADALFSNRTRETTWTDVAMGTTVTVKLYGGSQEQARSLIESVRTLEETSLSWRLTDSDIARINAAAPLPAPADAQTIAWLQRIREISAASGGALSCTVGALTRLWDIGGPNARVPSAEELAAALSTVSDVRIQIGVDGIQLEAGQRLDLGAVGKGIACDEIAKRLTEQACERAVVSVGGSVLLYGEKPGGGDWAVSIRDPLGGENDALGTLALGACCVSTSGDYERFLVADGVSYHHILDPATGYPADSGLHAVTVVSASGLDSDALSTACFVLGYEKSLPLLTQFDAEAVFVTKDRRVLVTPGLQDRFRLTADGYIQVKP